MKLDFFCLNSTFHLYPAKIVLIFLRISKSLTCIYSCGYSAHFGLSAEMAILTVTDRKFRTIKKERRARIMKKLLVFLLFTLISMTLVQVTWAKGNPFDDLQNQINGLKATIQQQGEAITVLQSKVDALNPPQPIDMRGCWAITGRGARVDQNLISPQPAAVPNIFQTTSGRNFLKVTDQSPDGSFSGFIYRYETQSLPPNSPETLVTIPAYGGTTGSSFYLYSIDPESPATQSSTEYRFWTGTKISDTSLFGIGCVFRLIDKNVPNWTLQHQSFNVQLDKSTACPLVP